MDLPPHHRVERFLPPPQVAQRVAARLRGRDPPEEGLGGEEPGVVHPQGGEDPLPGKDVQALPREGAHQLPEGDEIEVAVDELRARLGLRLHPPELPERPGGPGPFPGQVEIGAQPGIVGQELAHRDLFLPPPGELRQVARHPVVQPQPPLLDEDHDGGGGGHDLGQGGDVEHRVGRHRLGRGDEGPVAEGAAVVGRAAPPHDHHRPGDLPGPDRLPDRLPDPLQARRVEARPRPGRRGARPEEAEEPEPSPRGAVLSHHESLLPISRYRSRYRRADRSHDQSCRIPRTIRRRQAPGSA